MTKTPRLVHATGGAVAPARRYQPRAVAPRTGGVEGCSAGSGHRPARRLLSTHPDQRLSPDQGRVHHACECQDF